MDRNTESAARALLLSERHLDQRQAEREASDKSLPALLIAKGAMEAPARIKRPSRLRRTLRRFYRDLCAFLLAPRPFI